MPVTFGTETRGCTDASTTTWPPALSFVPALGRCPTTWPSGAFDVTCLTITVSPACFSVVSARGSDEPTTDGTETGGGAAGGGGGGGCDWLDGGVGGAGAGAGGGEAAAGGGPAAAWCAELDRVTAYATPSPPSRRMMAISHGHGVAAGT